jgi:hypothetical protein
MRKIRILQNEQKVKTQTKAKNPPKKTSQATGIKDS